MKLFSKRVSAIVAVLMIVSGFAFAQKNDESAGVERYGIYIGSNIGGKNNERLLYAGTDAISFQKTMSEIGGIAKSNSVLLLDPTKADVDNAMSYISELINRNRKNAKRSEFIFYYSGHSDEKALLLGKNVYDYSSLKAAISDVPSDVHVVILDSCYSGNFIRTKGGQKQKPFLVDDSTIVKGHAYLSSSSSMESSQESDEIGSSFFTNAMITGLRGAADSSGDKKVTLNELYSYAFSETLSKTENSSVGPQHPNYNITLVGSGDLILSDISNSDCVLTIAKELSGKVIIRDKNEKLVSEVNKSSANPVFLALEEGQYSVTVISEGVTLQGSFDLSSRRNYILASNNLSPVIRTASRLRGNEESVSGSENSDEEKDTIYYPVTFSFFFNEFYRGSGKDIITSFAIGLFRSDVYKVNGVMVAGVGNEAKYVDGVQVAGVYNMAEHNMGPQVAGIFNIGEDNMGPQVAGVFNITQKMMGAQVAGVFNITKQLTGVQGSGIFNLAQDVAGVQGSGILNFARDVAGVQGTGIMNVGHDVRYVQGAGVLNVAVGNMMGVQGAGVAGYAGNLTGVQGSGVANFVLRDVIGVQGAGVLNIAGGKVTGVQASGIANYAHEVKGVQVGILNICSGDVTGVQLGLINISKNGVLEFGTSYTTENDLRFTFNSGSKYLYSVLGYSAAFKCMDPSVSIDQKYGHVILGMGTRIEAGPVNFDVEVLGNEILSGEVHYNKDNEPEVDSRWYPSIRFAVGFTPVKHLNIFAGAMMSFEYNGNTQAFEKKTNNIVIETNNPKVKLHPEFDFGLRYQFN